jgi:hypothetical protein
MCTCIPMVCSVDTTRILPHQVHLKRAESATPNRVWPRCWCCFEWVESPLLAQMWKVETRHTDMDKADSMENSMEDMDSPRAEWMEELT